MPETAVKEKEIVETASETSGGLYLLSALVDKDAALADLAELIKAAGADVKKTENLGPKNLYVKIAGTQNLTLVSVYFTAEPAVANELQTSLKSEEEIKRFLLTTWRGDINPPARRPRSYKNSAKEGEK